MADSLGSLFLLLTIGALGVLLWPWFTATNGVGEPPGGDGQETGLEATFLIFLLGFATLSLLLMLLALFGVFSLLSLTMAVAGLAGSSWWHAQGSGKCWRPWRGAWGHRLGFLVVAAISLASGWLAPPFAARLMGSDASVYLGAAAQLAESGRLQKIDPLVAEMSLAEREVLFANRFDPASKGGALLFTPQLRFPGGVFLTDPATPVVSFSFYHLWPIWLALGLKLGGSGGGGAVVQPLMAAVSLLSLFLLGQRVAGRGFALSLVLLFFFVFPQHYFSRMPISELAAQSFFLSGLFCFVLTLPGPGGGRRYLQLLAGGLWGALCLCRVDGLLSLLPALGGSFLLIPTLRRKMAGWWELVVTLLFYQSLAVGHQLASSAYLPLFATFPGVAGLLVWLGPAIREYEKLLLAAWLVLLFFAYRGRRREVGKGAAPALTMAAFFLLGAAIWSFFILRAPDWSQVALHLQWLTLYLPYWLLAAFAAGLGFLAWVAIRQPQSEAVIGVLCLFLLAPMVAFLFNPMVSATQPWAIRRFVVMGLPLFILLPLLGWYLGPSALSRLLARYRRFWYPLLFVGLLAFFCSQSAFLLLRPLYAGLDRQINLLARQLPAGSLVVVPDVQASLHLQIALLASRPQLAVLLLPLNGEVTAAQEPVILSYMQRQVASGRPVIVLVSQGGALPGQLGGHFTLEYLFSAALNFDYLPEVESRQFPGRIEPVAVITQAFQLRSGEQERIPATIAVGRAEEDLPWVGKGFHPPESQAGQDDSRFRWSMEEAELFLPPGARQARIFFHHWRPEIAPPEKLALFLDGVPLSFRTVNENGRSCLEVVLPVGLSPAHERRKLLIRCQAFSMRELGLSADSRVLGLPIYRLELRE